MPKYKQEVERNLHALLGLAHMQHIRNGKQQGVQDDLTTPTFF
jgi:hypothetical protein